jgi:hypothetical protein
MPDPSPAPILPPERPRLRLTAFAGLVASVLVVVSYFLPWVVVPPVDRVRLRAELAPRIDDLAREAPAEADGVRSLLDHVANDGHLAGIDLFHYLRRALALHVHYEGEEPAEEVTGGAWVVRRAFRLAAFLLASVPLLCAVLALVILAGGLRRVGTRTLIGLVVTGCCGGAVAIAWLRVVESLTWDVLGNGVRLAMAAGVAQAGAGLFGVTGRIWWRVYAWSILVLGVLAGLAWMYVQRGVLP